ncbi:fibroblast growth factor receptor homolog 1-like [Culex pipiens pallens]|uniref:fibroblast growth factor receptor homolog 1-like n=1 Tax=Culex pipiens pallens TaxID=42434 RepID=UPI0022AB4CAF|nr:fibroblast growth factor receptor homolog 1-like [Culex pipiens pallens]
MTEISENCSVTRNEENSDIEEFQIPIVTIHRSMIIENNLYKSASVSEYEYPTDWEWEVQRCRISLGKLLGEGAFGQVVLAEAFGFLKGDKTVPVAVKMLKESHSDDDVENLVCELEIMKMVGRHPNVINLLGCCTNDGPLYVIMEHAIHGSLKGFLLEHILESDEAEKKTITIQQLVSFASQIASGMVYLSSIKCVHRDLAARNILVAEGLVMKISDFGLARDVHHQEYYRKLTAGRMPIRWMAPESLEFLFFDSKTDVWSYGVLLWEIMTLGGQPYQFLPARENLLRYLKQGHRLEQPRFCPDKVYRVMNQCWQSNPEQRSSFIEIGEQLKTCLDEAPDEKLNLNHD